MPLKNPAYFEKLVLLKNGTIESETGDTVIEVDSSGNIKLSAEVDIKMSDGKAIVDTNANELLEFGVTASAVNHIGITNAATGDNPIVSCEGEANTGITFQNSEAEEILILDSVATSVNELTIRSAATGNKPIVAATGEADNGIEFHNDQAEEILILASAATSVNELTITSAATGAAPSLAATGDDTNINLALSAKGSGGVQLVNDESILDSNGLELVSFSATASAVNELTVTNAATGNSPTLSATGDDTNIDLTLVSKGTGRILSSDALSIASDGTHQTAISDTQLILSHVDGFSNVGMAMIANTGNGCALLFGDTDDDDIGSISYENSGDYMAFTTNTAEGMRIDSSGNVGIGSTSWGTNAAKVLSIASGTVPASGPADSVQLYSLDLSAGNTMLGIYTEGTNVGTGTPAADRTIAFDVNGTTLYVLASTAAS